MKIESKSNDGSVNPLVRGLVTSLSDAILMIGQAREHHAFCIRACAMIELYEKEWLLFNKDRWQALDKDAQEQMKKWYGWIQLNSEYARMQKGADYIDVIRRSIVLLADIVENITESFIHMCLKYYRTEGDAIESITGFRSRGLGEYTDIRRGRQKLGKVYPKK